MTSRELTSGFDFWSLGHLRMAVMHLHTKFGADNFWKNQDIIYDYQSDIHGTGNRSEIVVRPR